MDIADSGTTFTAFDFKTLPDFRVKTKLAIKWRQLASGNYDAVDRGSDSDIYEADLSLYGKESVVNEAIDAFQANRTAPDHVLQLSNFYDTEKMFGENVDHSGTIQATIMNISPRTQNTWKGYRLDLTLRAVKADIAFTGSSSFPTLSYCEVGAAQDSSWTVNKYDYYTGGQVYVDSLSDSGTFSGIFTVSTADMVLLRNYIRSQRSGNYTLSDTFGIDNPFGSRTANSYPFTTKLIEWEDLGWWGLKYHKIKLTFAEVV